MVVVIFSSFLSLIDRPHPFVQVIGESACHQSHDEDDPMHVEQSMKAKHKQDKAAVDKNQNGRCFHVTKSHVNQQMVDVPTVGSKWRSAPHYSGDEYPKCVENGYNHYANGHSRSPL